jgi:lysophospholipase L1-like esterase
MGDAPPRQKRSLKKKLLLGSAIWIGLLVAGELAVRVREKVLYGTFSRAGSTSYAAKDGTVVLKPNLEVHGANLGWTTNSLGFRGREVVTPKPKGTFRIVCVGGSTTFDTLARSNEESWPARLEALLRARHPGVEVVNMGVAGHTLRDTLGPAIWPKVELVQPDLIVCYHAANEIATTARASTPPALPKSAVLGRVLEGLTDASLLAYKVWLFADSFKPPAEAVGLDDLPRAPEEEFRANLRILEERSKALGARLALGTFALRWRPDQDAATKKRLSASAASFFPGVSLGGLESVFARYNASIEKAATDRCILIPIAKELSGHDEFFGDSMHFSAEGSKKMSETVADALEGAKALP